MPNGVLQSVDLYHEVLVMQVTVCDASEVVQLSATSADLLDPLPSFTSNRKSQVRQLEDKPDFTPRKSTGYAAAAPARLKVFACTYYRSAVHAVNG